MTTQNPLRAWLEQQPLEITIAEVARRLGLSPNYTSELFSDDDPKRPSLMLACRIEELTGVAPIDIATFVETRRKHSLRASRKAA